MGGTTVTVRFARDARAPADAAGQLHEHVSASVVAWLEQHLHTELGWLEEYFSGAKRYATERGLWGPGSDPGELTYFFPDFAGLHHLGAGAMSHWFELALATLHPYLGVRADELGLRLLDPPRGADRLASTPRDAPLVQLGPHTYWVECSRDGAPPGSEPVLFSRDDLPRRALASLSPEERALVERVLLHRLCQCDLCSYVRPKAWGGRDPWGGSFDFGMSAGEALLRGGEHGAARRELARGAMLGAPWEGWQYAVWIACTYAPHAETDPAARAHAQRWLARSLADGHDGPDALVDDEDLAPLRGPELDALIARGARPPTTLPTDGSPAGLGRAHALISGRLSLLASVAGAELRGDGMGPLPLPPPASFRLLVEQLRREDALAPLAEVAALCMRAPSCGATFAQLTERLELSFDADLSITVSEASVVAARDVDERSPVEVTVWGDRRVTERDAATGAERRVGTLTPLELTRLACDAYDARLDEVRVPPASRLADPSPGGGPPPASRLTVRLPGAPPHWCEALSPQGGDAATYFALAHHVEGVTRWARYRASTESGGDVEAPPRFPSWTIAEQRARTLRRLEAAARGDATAVEIAWHGPATETEAAWFSLEGAAVFRRASRTDPPFHATKRQGEVSPAELVHVARELLRLGFPTLGVPGAERDPVARPRAGCVGLRVSARHDVGVAVELPAEALAEHLPLASLFRRLEQIVTDARRRDPRRRELVLPALPRSRSSGRDAPWTLPLRVLVLADLRGERARGPLDDVPMLRVSSETVAACRDRMLAGKGVDAVPVWRDIEALCATARDASADVVVDLLDVGLEDLRDDLDDAVDLGRSGLARHLVAATLDADGATPIDAVLLSMELGRRDATYLNKLETLLENGPMQAFARFPDGVARTRHRLVDVEPFLAGRALVRAFSDDPCCRTIEGLPGASAATFAVARVARHLSPLQLASGDRSFDGVARRANGWLSSQSGFGRALSSHALVEEDDQLSSTAISYTLRVKFELGLEASVPFLLRLGGPIDAEPGGDAVVAEAVLAAADGAVTTHDLVAGGSTGPGTGAWLRLASSGAAALVELVGGAAREVPLGPAGGEAFVRLTEALAAWMSSGELGPAPATPPVRGLAVSASAATLARPHPARAVWSPAYATVMQRLDEVSRTLGRGVRERGLDEWRRVLELPDSRLMVPVRPPRPSPHEQQAWRLVLQWPEHDGPRAALASLFAAEGDPRGEFVVAQLKHAALLRGQASGPEVARVAARVRAMLDEHGASWALAIEGLATRPTFRRGFVDGVAASPRAFVASADELFGAAPVLHLDVLGTDGLDQLFASPHLARLRSLNLFDQRIGDAGARALACSPHARSLVWLDLGYNQLTTAGLEWLASSPNLPNLSWVNLVSNGFEDPCDRLGGVEGDAIHSFDTPASQPSLERRFGIKRWLHWRPASPAYARPDPAVLVGGA